MQIAGISVCSNDQYVGGHVWCGLGSKGCDKLDGDEV
jgi:hypothetical protein